MDRIYEEAPTLIIIVMNADRIIMHFSHKDGFSCAVLSLI